MLAEHMSVMLAGPNGEGVKAEDGLSVSGQDHSSQSSTNGGTGSIPRVFPSPTSLTIAHSERCQLVGVLDVVSLVTGGSGWLWIMCRSRYNVAEETA